MLHRCRSYRDQEFQDATFQSCRFPKVCHLAGVHGLKCFPKNRIMISIDASILRLAGCRRWLNDTRKLYSWLRLPSDSCKGLQQSQCISAVFFWYASVLLVGGRIPEHVGLLEYGHASPERHGNALSLS